MFMMIEVVWYLFKKTGELDYFIKYRKMVEGKIDTLGDNGD